ncbi:hypothetical protein H4219_006303 [Mycoemilia scoparia]|uniref:Uncharacterized protein n=1 Tax=Mycoemilia scoparia TaxID=417184 RepID=A0A9W8DMC0_9FUNG|nr:hypothetical protein H4219_006303 [Mycoemilia scoparia]
MYYSKLFLVALLAVAASSHVADAAQLAASGTGVASPHAKRNSNGIMIAKRQEEEGPGEGEGNDEPGLPPTEEDDQLVPAEEEIDPAGTEDDNLEPAEEDISDGK